ncbi:MAG: hypothetical protein OXI67_02280 [Candidatus Poribacteria bacterium]|nr:hypothetical protein [Candidatus Poribacteria bacterium]
MAELYDKTGRAPRIVLMDETDILQDYRFIVIAVPFRKRAIPIYWKIYKKDTFDKMVYPSHNVLVQEFCYQFIKPFETALPNVKRPVLVFDRYFARAKYLMKSLMEMVLSLSYASVKMLAFITKDNASNYRH